jgi:hypothetical protein
VWAAPPHVLIKLLRRYRYGKPAEGKLPAGFLLRRLFWPIAKSCIEPPTASISHREKAVGSTNAAFV